MKPGRVLFELSGVGEDVAREALRLAIHKLPFKADKGDRLVGNRVFFVKKSTDVNLKSKAPVAIGIQGFVFKKWNAVSSSIFDSNLSRR